jgi:DNA-binding protein HU-beta
LRKNAAGIIVYLLILLWPYLKVQATPLPTRRVSSTGRRRFNLYEPQAGCLTRPGQQERGLPMSKAFIAEVIQNSAEITGVAANRAAADLIEAIVKEMKKNGKFTLPSFGTFTVRKTKARKGVNPRTGEEIKVKAGKTVRFKASPSLKKVV